MKTTRSQSVIKSEINFDEIKTDLAERQHSDSSIIPIRDFVAVLDFYNFDHFSLDLDNLHDQCKKFDLNINLYVGTPDNCDIYSRPLRQKYSKTIKLLMDGNLTLTHLILNEIATRRVYHCSFDACPFFTEHHSKFDKHIEA